ncbi:MAG: 23S rRNA (pseudouridine(1915)-N(3))-methyltransferase RlmH [Oscillospiraceae bacterium]|nr:23S rRNA (pseudouridine(1915)-N(3))-methyltransferase RlmH [Oscillospiraceae bacterium]
MIDITVVCLGKLKEAYLRDACAEYVKRLKSFCRLEVCELTPARFPDDPSAAEVEAALSEEAAMIRKRLPLNARVYALCVEGDMMSSEELCRDLTKAAVFGHSRIAMIIGSSFGLSDEIKRRADVRLSMSAMTFPHQLARVMLLEQLYRVFQIESGGKYHK